MRFYKEQYRKFENSRFIYSFGQIEGAAEKVDKQKDDKSEQDSLEKRAEDSSVKIKTSLSSTRSLIDGMKGNKGEEKAIAKLAKKLHTNTSKKFEDILTRYQTEREKVGESTLKNNPNNEVLKGLNAEAGEHLSKIQKRVSGDSLSRTLKMQERQDSLDKTQKINDNPELKEKSLKRQKVNFVKQYLDQHDDTSDMTSQEKQNLAKLIVEAGLVKIPNVDLDSKEYSGDNLDKFFKDVDEFYNKEGKLGKQLEGGAKKVMSHFISKLPSIKATPNEISYFKDLILKHEADHYGVDEGPDSHLSKAATLLAKRYDVRFDGAKVKYAIDLTALDGGEKAVIHPEKFERVIRGTISKDNANTWINDSSKLDDYEKWIEGKTEKLQSMKKKVWDGGSADSWDDLESSSDLTKLMSYSQKVSSEVDKIEETEQEESIAKGVEKKEAKLLSNFSEAVQESNLGKKTELLKKDGYKTTKDNATPEYFKEHGEANETFRKGNTTIKIHIDSESEITLTITDETEASKFKTEKKYTPEEFKDVDLVEMAEKGKDNLKKNRATYKEVEGVIKSADLPHDIKLSLPESSSDDLASSDYDIPDANITIDDTSIGSIKFIKDSEGEIKATISVGTEETGPIELNELNNTLKKSSNKYKEHAEKNQEILLEITDKIGEDLSTLMKEGEEIGKNGFKFSEDLTIEPSTTLTKENLTYKGINVPVAKVKNTNGDEVAEIHIAAQKNGDNPREYKIVYSDSVVQCKNIEEVKTRLTENKDTLAYIPPKPKPVELEAKVGVNTTKAKANLISIATKLFGDTMEGIDPKDPQFDNAINKYINGLDQKAIKRLSHPKAAAKLNLSPEAQKALISAFREAYGFEKLEKSDSKEVEMIGGLKTTGGESLSKVLEGTSVLQILSMSHEFKTDGGVLKIRDGSNFKNISSPQNLKKYLPADMQKGYQVALETGTAPEDLIEQSEKHQKTREAMSKLGDAMKDLDDNDAFKKMGLIEKIASFAKLFKIAQEAFKSGDFQSLNDALKDVNNNKNPAEEMNKVREKVYDKKIKEIDDPSSLLAMYKDPYGKEAKTIFDNVKPKPRYRIQLKHSIKAKLQDSLGIEIIDIEFKPAGITRIAAWKGRQKIYIHLENDGDINHATVEEANIVNEKEQISLRTDKTKIGGLTSGTDNLVQLLQRKAPTPPPLPPIPPKKEKVAKVDGEKKGEKSKA